MVENTGPELRWITSPVEIRRMRRAGRPYRAESVVVWIAKEPPGGTQLPSVCIVAARGFRNAVTRNRARRRTRGAVLDSRHLLQSGKRYLVECRPGAETSDYQELVNEIQCILRKATGNQER